MNPVKIYLSFTRALDQPAKGFNAVVERNEAITSEIIRVEQAIRREGRMTEHANVEGAVGGWQQIESSSNSLIGGLVQPTSEVTRVIGAVAQGDLSQKMALEIDGERVKGEVLRIETTLNASEATVNVRSSAAPAGARLLIVEDDEDCAEPLMMLLEQFGQTVEVVSDGFSAVEAARSGAFDAALVDIGLPGMDTKWPVAFG